MGQTNFPVLFFFFFLSLWIQCVSIHYNHYFFNTHILTALASGSSFKLAPVSCSTLLIIGSTLAFWHCKMPSHCFFRKKNFCIKTKYNTHSLGNINTKYVVSLYLYQTDYIYCPYHLFLPVSTKLRK